MRDDSIVHVGPATDVAAAAADLPELHLGDSVLLPGFVDAHCHLEWSLTGGLVVADGFAAWLGALLRLSPRMRPEDHAAAAMLGALRCLENGTTTVADSGPTGAATAALRALGLRGVVHLETFGRHTGREARDAAREFADRVEALDDGSRRVRVGVAPHAPYTVGPGYWSALADHPDLADRPWTTHLAESPDESRLLGRGDGPLADLFADRGTTPGRWDGTGGPVRRLHDAGALRPGLVAAHCVQMDRVDVALLGSAGVTVAHCPGSNAALGCGRSPVEWLREADVPVGLGTDSPASGGGFDLRREARVCGATHARAAPSDARDLVALATLGGARTLGMDGIVGTLEPGKRADIIAVTPATRTSDPYASVLAPDTTVRMVMVDGAVLLDGDRLPGVDRVGIVAAATRARSRLTG